MFCFLVIKFSAIVIGAEIIQRRTKFGDVIGVVYTSPSGNTAEKYLGLPYAHAPVGPLRFEYPVPLHSFPTSPYNATFRRPWCLQDEIYDYQSVGVEDCLYLNIFTPRQSTNNSTFPVLFWIHGGSYRSGSGDVFNVDGAIDNFASKEVVLVTVNYRLGALGFMSILNNELPGNYGLEDQLLALQWVNKYIDDFGGDKQSITICGESSGAASVNLLAFSPKSRDLFHKIIMISGTAAAPWAVAPGVTKHFSEEVMADVGCEDGDVLECLKSRKYFDILIEGQLAIGRDAIHNMADPFDEQNQYAIQSFILVTPVVDAYRGNDSIVPFPLRQLISMSKFRVPVLLGFSKGEISRPALPIFEKLEHLLPLGRLNNRREAIEKIKKHYCGNSSEEACSLLGRRIGNDYSIHVPMCMTANMFAKRGAPAYVYCFDLKNEGNDEPAEHLSDVAFLFNDTSLIRNNMDPPDLPVPAARIKSFILDSFLNFIKTGDPNNDESSSPLGIWPRYREGESTVVRIQNKMIEMEGCYENETEFWKSLDAEYAKYSEIVP